MSERIMISIRVRTDDLERIDRLAGESKLSRTDYMVRCSLGQLSDPRAADTVLSEHEQRLGRLEELAFGQ